MGVLKVAENAFPPPVQLGLRHASSFTRSLRISGLLIISRFGHSPCAALIPPWQGKGLKSFKPASLRTGAEVEPQRKQIKRTTAGPDCHLSPSMCAGPSGPARRFDVTGQAPLNTLPADTSWLVVRIDQPNKNCPLLPLRTRTVSRPLVSGTCPFRSCTFSYGHRRSAACEAPSRWRTSGGCAFHKWADCKKRFLGRG